MGSDGALSNLPATRDPLVELALELVAADGQARWARIPLVSLRLRERPRNAFIPMGPPSFSEEFADLHRDLDRKLQRLAQ